MPEFMELFRGAASEVDAFREGTQSAEHAARRIFARLEDSGLCPPHWKLTDPERRCPTTFTLLPLARLAAWGYFGGPASVRRSFDLRGRVLPLFAALAKDVGVEAGRSAGLVARLVKDALTR